MFKLFLYNAAGKEIAIYRVCLPKFMPSLSIKGEVKAVYFNPYWRPTEKTRADYLIKFRRELPKIIKPNDPRNAMGKVKIEIKFFTPGVDPAARIYGTNNKASIGKHQSRWCIRLFNKDIIALGKKLKGKERKLFSINSQGGENGINFKTYR